MRGSAPAPDPYVPERGNPGYEVRHYELELDYSIASNHLEGRALLRMLSVEPLPRLSLDLVGLRVSKAMVDGRPARWQQRRGKVHLTPAEPILVDEEFTVELRYAGKPGLTSSRWGPVGWEELRDGVLVAAQPSGASTWFPCNDVARQKASYDVAVTAASPYRVVVNGELRSKRTRGSTTTWSYRQAEPTSPYLMTIHVGRYEEQEVSRSPVRIRGIFEPQHGAAFDVAFAPLERMMALFEERFGPYPFAAGYTVVVCPEPLEIPLEAQGQAIFGTNHLSGEHERLVAHELAHQWFGNSLTAATWKDVWLHEGFACYAEWLWSEGSGGPDAAAHARVHHQHLSALPQDLVLADPGPSDMFDDRVYKRGALTLQALRLFLGDDRFFALLRRWTDANRHGVVTTGAFEAMAAEVAGEPLDDLFDAWLRMTAMPQLTAP